MATKENKFSVILILLFFSISLIVTLNWFKGGFLFATAEEGMPFYSPQRTALLDSSVWQGDGMGYLNASILSRYPPMLIAKYLNLTLPSNIVQALFFLLIIFFGLIGAFNLAKNFTQRSSASLFASLFYLFNLYTMSQVWARALFVFMFVWAFLPWFIFLFIKVLYDNRKVWILLFVVFQIIFSYSYIFPTSIFVFWVPAGIILIIKLIKNISDRKTALNLLRKSLLIGILWTVVNSWWLYPFIKFSNSSSLTNPPSETNLDSLQAVSGSFPIFQILQLRQKNYFNYASNKELPWGNFYDSDISYALSLFGLFLVFLGIYKFRKNRNYIYIMSIFLIALFVSKGTNPPFGYSFYKWLFSNIYFTGIFRNSFEKFGLVFVLFYSLFFGLGIVTTIDSIKSFKVKKMTVFFLITLFYIYLVNPIWTGKVFWNYYWVKVPNYYKTANEYFVGDTSDYRILILPPLSSHGVGLIWGYRGDEPSRFLFDKDVISRRPPNNYTKIYDEITYDIEGNKELIRILEQSNIKYVILNYDIVMQSAGYLDPNNLSLYLKNQKYLELVKKFGNLEVYKNNGLLNSSPFVVEGSTTYYPKYTKLNDTHYKINITESKDRFSLIFKESFDKNWIATVGSETFDDHRLAYGYANAWNIDKEGSFQIDLIFKVWPWE